VLVVVVVVVTVVVVVVVVVEGVPLVRSILKCRHNVKLLSSVVQPKT